MQKIVLVVLLALWPLSSVVALPFSKDQQKRIGEIVREYLVANPEVLRDALIALQQREAEAEQNAKKDLIKNNMSALVKDSQDPVGGNAGGKVTVVEFFDYNCPYCRRAKPIVGRLLNEDKRVRYVYKEYPILSKTSGLAARVALAVWKQNPDKYESLHKGMMKPGERLTEEIIKRRVREQGLDWNRVKQRADQPDISAQVEKNISLARKLGINGTPSFVIGEQFFPGLVPLEDLKRAVDVTCRQQKNC